MACRLLPSDLLPKDMLANLGLDSLSLIELTGRVKAVAGVDLPIAQLPKTATVEQVGEEVQ